MSISSISTRIEYLLSCIAMTRIRGGGGEGPEEDHVQPLRVRGEVLAQCRGVPQHQGQRELRQETAIDTVRNIVHTLGI